MEQPPSTEPLDGEAAPGEGRNLLPLRIFQREIQLQCEAALVSLQDTARALQANDQARVWNALQAFLVAAAKVSKLLWSPQEKIKGRGRALRESLQVPDSSPLRSRALRDHFEHFDERLDDWATNSERHNFADGVIGPPSAVIGGIDPPDYMRAFEPGDFRVHLRGEVFELEPVVQALEELWQRARVESRRASTLPPGESPLPPYTPRPEDEKPFTEALRVMKSFTFGGNIRVVSLKPPPDSPTRDDGPEELRAACEEVLGPLYAFIEERRRSAPPFPMPIPGTPGPSYQDQMQAQEDFEIAYARHADESRRLFRDNLSPSVRELAERLYENGFWDPSLSGLYDHPALSSAAHEPLADKLRALCQRAYEETSSRGRSGE